MVDFCHKTDVSNSTHPLAVANASSASSYRSSGQVQKWGELTLETTDHVGKPRALASDFVSDFGCCLNLRFRVNTKNVG